METLLSRYRNLTVLLVVVFSQLVYLAWQVKTNRDERLLRVWAATAVTPMAGIVEAIRRNTIGFLQDYFILLDVREQNRKLKSDNDHLRMENVYFRNELRTAEHAQVLTLFQAQIPSETIPARVIGNSTVVTAKAVFIDRGSTSRIEKGMAVVTPEGIVGKVAAVYPLVSQVLLVTDATFKVGVESQKGHVHGVLNCGTGKCIVEQIQNEEKVDDGEWFFTSGEDRIFPKGFPVGVVTAVQQGPGMKDIHLSLSGAPGGAEEVLVVLEGIHRAIPTQAPSLPTSAALDLPAPQREGKTSEDTKAHTQTEADKVVDKYQNLGKEQGHVYGGVGSPVPNFNNKPAGSADTSAGGKAGPPEASKPTDSTPAPSVPSTGSPQVLGAKPGSQKQPAPPPSSTASPVAPRPRLPLGAPRPRSNTSSTSNSSSPPPQE